jgi:hypothetical protein
MYGSCFFTVVEVRTGSDVGGPAATTGWKNSNGDEPEIAAAKGVAVE